MESEKRTILLIETDRPASQYLAGELSRHFDVQRTSAEGHVVDVARRVSPDVIIIDATIPSLDNLRLIDVLRGEGFQSPLLVLSPEGHVRAAVHALKRGADDVVDGTASVDHVLEVVTTLLTHSEVPSQDRHQVRTTRRQKASERHGDFGALVGRCPSMQALFGQIEQLAVRDTTVLITGESGTGKELVAREIHKRSQRRDGPFVAINCAAIPETLIESELFGHEKGAFTHAVERRLGQFELADGGTLLLDEIGELSVAVQVKLLRFLQEQEFFRVGRSKPISVNVRVLAATNRDLDDLVRTKAFRHDLLYRINVVNVHIPPLRDRTEDIPRLITAALQSLREQYGNRQLSIADDAMRVLIDYPWPGNIRELENVIEGLLALAPHDQIRREHLPARIRERGDAISSTEHGRLPHRTNGLAFDDAERMFETEMIIDALRKTNFVQTRAAELLGISRRILKYKMDKLKINERGELKVDSKKSIS